MCLIICDGCGHPLEEEATPFQIYSHYSTRALVSLVAAALITTLLVWVGTNACCASPTTVTFMVVGSLVALAAYVKCAVNTYLAIPSFRHEEEEGEAAELS